MKTSKKILSILLAVMMIISIIPITVSAATYSGTCGDNLTWEFDESTGTLTISGTGAMYDYFSSNRPWESYEDSIKEVLIEDGVTSIGTSAFTSYDSLTSITIPDSVTTIDIWAFASCDSLISITVDSDNDYYSSDEYGVLFNKDKTTLIQYPIGNTRTNYTIPDSVTTIGRAMFEAFAYCDSLTSVIIPDSVTSIGGYAFYYCTSLTSVTIPDSVTTISAYAFHNCESLTSVTIGDSVTKIGDSAFSSCYNLTSVTIPDSVTTIGEYAFASCDSLESVTIPDSVTTIGEYAFASCDSLESVTIGNSVTAIGDFAFYYCGSLTDVYYSGTKEQWNNISIESDNSYLTSARIHYNYNPDTHITSAITTSPTCTEQGYTTYTCECGYIYKLDYVNATGHSYTSEITTPATHLTTGVETFTCACGKSYTNTIAKTTEHTYNSVVTTPTCTAKGFTTYTCACGNSYVGNYVNVTPHKLEWVIVSVASCNTNGVMHGYCQDCSYFEVKTTPLTGHADNDGDGYCDACRALLDPSVECNHSCHKGGISGFFWKITLFFSRLFGSNKFCECGIAHY